MAAFVYSAVDAKGKAVKGKVEAKSVDEARAKLTAKNLFPTSLKQAAAEGAPAAAGAKPGAAAPAGGAAAAGKRPQQRSQTAASNLVSAAAMAAGTAPDLAAKKKGFSLFGGGVNAKQLTMFTSQFSTLIDAGLPIVRSLKILADQQKPGTLKNILSAVAEDVEGGSSLSEAMSRHPKAFDKLYCNMVKAGEASGALDTILRRLSEFMEKNERLKAKIKGASMYPVAVLSISALIVLGIMTFVIPKFKEMFAQMKVPLPLPTKLLLAMAENMKLLIIPILLSPFALYFVYKTLMKNPNVAIAMDRIKLRVPVLGDVIKKSIIARFSRTFGTLISSGVAILEALTICRGTIPNQVLGNAIEKVAIALREGETIAEPLGESGLFDDIIVNMIDVGEETGELDKMLIKIADNYDTEVDLAVESMTKLLEPFLIVFMGVVIGGIVIALFLPMVGMISNLSGK